MSYASEPWPRFWRMLIIALGALILCSCEAVKPRSSQREDVACSHASPQSAMVTDGDAMADSMSMDAPRAGYGRYARAASADALYAQQSMHTAGHHRALAARRISPRRRTLRAKCPSQRPWRGSRFRYGRLRRTVPDRGRPQHGAAEQPGLPLQPCFGAVRQVVDLEAGVQIERAAGVREPVKPATPTTQQMVGDVGQKLRTHDDIAAQPAALFHAKQGSGEVSVELSPRGFHNAFKAYENFSAIRNGVLVKSEKAWLTRYNEAAQTWTTKQAVQVVIDTLSAKVDIGAETSERLCGRSAESSAPATHQGGFDALCQPGRRGRFHAPLRQRRRSNHSSREDHRQPEHAVGIPARHGAVQSERQIHLAAKRGRIARGPLRVDFSLEARRGRRVPLPLPRAVSGEGTAQRRRKGEVRYWPSWIAHFADLGLGVFT